jgi:hypothetical protein
MEIPLKDNSHLIPNDAMVKKVRLLDIVHTEDVMLTITREQYYACSQHDYKPFDWDGFFVKFGSVSDVPVSGYVPLKKRQPSARMDLPRVIVNELSAMTFGDEKFPQLVIEGDSDAEDYAKELCKVAKLPTKILEARNNGGATGTAVVSWGFVDGKPVVDIHKRSQCTVFDWADYELRRPSNMLKAYTYKKRIFDSDGKPKTKLFYYARYWDEHVDICWRDIPEEVGATAAWWMLPSKAVIHSSKFCPVYWIQNYSDSDDIDGIGDYIDGSHSNFDQIDELLSATVKGTKANVDPTLVIHASKSENQGVLRKGSENAIFSEKGATYLELVGSSIETALRVLDTMRQIELDKAGVVILDQEKAGGTAVSASAMKQRYARMTARVDLLRDQYECAIIQIVKDMLEVARSLESAPVETESGEQMWSKIILPPRIEENDENDDKAEDGEPPKREKKKTKEVERKPGTSSNVTATWPPYFVPSWLDKKDAVDTVRAASNNQQVMSQRKAVATLAPMFGTEDVNQELGEIDEDKERSIERTQSLMEPGAPNQFGGQEKTPIPPKSKKEEDNKDK